MLGAKDWPVLLVRRDRQVISHFIPVVDPAMFDCATHVPARGAVLVVALYHSTSLLTPASAARNGHRERVELPLDHLVPLITEPETLDLVDTDHVGPLRIRLVLLPQLDFFEDSIDLRAQEALNFSAFLGWVGK